MKKYIYIYIFGIYSNSWSKIFTMSCYSCRPISFVFTVCYTLHYNANCK